MKRLLLLSTVLLITFLSAADDAAMREETETHIKKVQVISMHAKVLAEKLNETMHDFKDVVDPLLLQQDGADSHVVPEYPAKVTFLPLGDGQREMCIEYVSEPRIVMRMRPQRWTAIWSSNEDSQHSERLIGEDEAFLLAWVTEEKATFIAIEQATSKVSTDNTINN